MDLHCSDTSIAQEGRVEMVCISLFIGYIFCKKYDTLSVSLLPNYTSRVNFHSAYSFLICDLQVYRLGVERGFVLVSGGDLYRSI